MKSTIGSLRALAKKAQAKQRKKKIPTSTPDEALINILKLASVKPKGHLKPIGKGLESFGIKLDKISKKVGDKNLALIQSFVNGDATGWTAHLETRGDTLFQTTKKGNRHPIIKKYQDKIILINTQYPKGADDFHVSYTDDIEAAFDKAGWIRINFNFGRLEDLHNSNTRTMMLESLLREAQISMDRYWVSEKKLNGLEKNRDVVLTELTEAAKGKGNYNAIKNILLGIEHNIKQEGLDNARDRATTCRAFIRQLERELDTEQFRRLEELPGRLYPFTKMKTDFRDSLRDTPELSFEAIRIKQRVEVTMKKADGYINVLKTISGAQDG